MGSERQQGTRMVGPSPTACPLTVASAMDRVVRTNPDAPAVVDGYYRFNYRELDEAVRRLVTQLREEGVAPGMRVALMTLPSAMHMVAWLALVRLGALPLALHTRESHAALASVCDAFDVALLIHDASLDAAAAGIAACLPAGLRRMRVRSGAAAADASGSDGVTEANFEAYPPASDLPRLAEDDPAVIILSSGTTSLPKGIVHTHRNLIEAARSGVAMFGHTGPGARGIVPYSTAFTGCYISWFPFLHAGGCNVFLEQFDLERYAATIRQERITHMSLTPTMWRKLLAMMPDPSSYISIRLASFAAEPMDSATLARIRDIVTPHVVQAYGSTETLGLVTVNAAADMAGERLLSVGRPFPGTEVRLMAEDGVHPVAQGEIGEIWVNSPSVAAGIWNNPALEAKVLHSDGECRWWRSGDLGRFDAEGFLFLEGRRDDMIISGGINILPAAIEEALLQHPHVAEAAVVGIKDSGWGELPHAFIIRASDDLDAEALDRFIRQSSLSDYQRPRAYHFVEALPYTATNKLNRKALREAGVPSATSQP
ncbi:class I adenylate-forming enzyme family protein [Sphingobium sp.]|uniref:class I adenylate-forming enzyme family protein n=1 Tax=Sphingobium sp. TaxID=1912891 RepID=UPI0028BE3130|nr:class I adenylate-forming enzyme family protein [Sphingobium sp.]